MTPQNQAAVWRLLNYGNGGTLNAYIVPVAANDEGIIDMPPTHVFYIADATGLSAQRILSCETFKATIVQTGDSVPVHMIMNGDQALLVSPTMGEPHGRATPVVLADIAKLG